MEATNDPGAGMGRANRWLQRPGKSGFRANIIGAIRNDAGMQVAISHCHPFQIQRTDLTFRRMFFKFFSG